MTRYLIPAAGLLGLMALPASAQDAKPASRNTLCPPGLIEAGKQVYADKACARCHMVAGKGNKTGKLDGVASKASADDMRKWLTTPVEMEAKLAHKPKVAMSSRKGMTLTDADVTALVAYLMTLR